MYVITIATQKGGQGKSTTTTNVAAGLALTGKRVLVVDLEPQAHAGKCLGIEVGRVDPKNSVGTAIIMECMNAGWSKDQIMAALYHVPDALMPDRYEETGLWLFGAEQRTLVTAEGQVTKDGNSSLRVLRDILMRVSDEFDFVVIDTPPSTQALCQMALAAGNGVVSVCQPLWLSFGGVTAIRSLTEKIPEMTLGMGDLKPQYLGALANVTNPPSAMTLEEIQVRNALATGVTSGNGRSKKTVKLYSFVTEIRKDARISAAANTGVPVVVSHNGFAPGQQYMSLIDEIATRSTTPASQWEIAEPIEVEVG